MREFRDYRQWVDAVLDDWDEEYYRAIFEVYCMAKNLLAGRKPFGVYYTVDSRGGQDGTEYLIVDDYYGMTLILDSDQGARELVEYLTDRFRVGSTDMEDWDTWSQRAHERCREDRHNWTRA
jgi:hypothetical protein